MSPDSLPVVDVAPLLAGEPPGPGARAAAAAIGRACGETGFFYVVGHGVDAALERRLLELARAFFALPEADKRGLAMERAGRAWRGWFPLGGELTAGRPDWKEGLYLGLELGPADPRVAAGWPLHGANLWPPIDGFRETVLAWMDALTGVGQAVLRGMGLALGLAPGFFHERYTRDPLVLFRLFHYPPLPAGAEPDDWSVAEHTDYGLLTLLLQDDAGGLEVRVGERWIAAPPLTGSLVCNLGDVLERLTGGLWRSTPHRVRNASGRARLSCPLFLDPAFDAVLAPIPGLPAPAGPDPARWDGRDLRTLSGTYGAYLLDKVRRVFPALGQALPGE